MEQPPDLWILLAIIVLIHSERRIFQPLTCQMNCNIFTRSPLYCTATKTIQLTIKIYIFHLFKLCWLVVRIYGHIKTHIWIHDIWPLITWVNKLDPKIIVPKNKGPQAGRRLISNTSKVIFLLYLSPKVWLGKKKNARIFFFLTRPIWQKIG